MEMRLTDGDWERDSQGMPVVLEGRAALLSRVENRLRIPRGSFVLNPELGSRLTLLREGCPGDLEPQAMQFAQEALAGLPQAEAVSAVIEGNPPGRVRLSVRILGELQEVEVAL